MGPGEPQERDRPAAQRRRVAAQLDGLDLAPWGQDGVHWRKGSLRRPMDDLANRLLKGDKRALARGISLVEDDDPAGWALVREVYPHTGKAAIVGLTGAPGAGKSTLIGALTKLRREAGREVAVLSIDPSSPFTHGALLGDRIRLTDHFLDPGVFIRSMANRGALGGLSEAALQAALLMDAAGKEDVFLETVGVGQAEIDVIDHADTVVLVLMPGSGDSIQALKAGIMEIPDVIVVNKADHPLTDTMVREIRGVLSLAPQRGWRVPIVKTEASRGQGVEELVEQLEAHRAFIEEEGTLVERRQRTLGLCSLDVALDLLMMHAQGLPHRIERWVLPVSQQHPRAQLLKLPWAGRIVVDDNHASTGCAVSHDRIHDFASVQRVSADRCGQ
jgi:LAO/AO transport system kinase